MGHAELQSVYVVLKPLLCPPSLGYLGAEVRLPAKETGTGRNSQSVQFLVETTLCDGLGPHQQNEQSTPAVAKPLPLRCCGPPSGIEVEIMEGPGTEPCPCHYGNTRYHFSQELG